MIYQAIIVLNNIQLSYKFFDGLKDETKTNEINEIISTRMFQTRTMISKAIKLAAKRPGWDSQYLSSNEDVADSLKPAKVLFTKYHVI